MTASPAEIARRALADHLAALPAGQLLTRYAAARDPEAFAGLVHQFGPMVLGTCRRVLGPSADADDAFQAVFLALSRQAGSFRDAAALPAWLHRVALRVSRKALARRSPSAALPDAVADPADPFADVAWRDVRRVLDEEVDGLPERYRWPVVLCWLDGLTRDEAAGKLGLSLNTLVRRLDAGRELLRSRLTRRGLAPVLATAVVATPTGLLQAVVPESLMALAVEFGVGGEVPAGVVALEAAAATPTRRLALVAILGAGAAAAGGLVYALNRPPRPPQVAEVPKPEGPLGVTVAPAPREAGPRPLPAVPRNRMRHDGARALVTFSPDGNTLAVASSDLQPWPFRLWDVAAGRELDRVKFSGRAVGTAFSPDGDTIAVWVDKWIVLHDARTGREKSAVDAPAGVFVGSFAISPDGKTLAVGMEGGARLWDADKGTEKAVLKWPFDPAAVRGKGAYVAFSRDGSTLATAGSDGIVRLWDMGTHQVKDTLDAHFVASLALSPDGKTVATVGGGIARVSVKLWDLAAKPVGVERLPSDEDRFLCAAFSPDGRRIAAGGIGKVVCVWDVKTRKQVAALSGHFRPVTSVAFRPDGTTLASASDDGTVKLWDLKTFREQGVIRGPKDLPGEFVAWVAHSPDGKSLAVGRYPTDPRFPLVVHWDLAADKAFPAVEDVPHRDSITRTAAFSPDGRTLAVGQDEGRIRFLDVRTGRVVRTLVWGGDGMWGGFLPYFLAYTPDGKTLVSGTGSRVALWDLDKGTIRTTINKSDLAGDSLQFALSTDGKTLAVCDLTSLRIVDVGTGKERTSFKPHEMYVSRAAFSPDGKTLATAGPRPVKGGSAGEGKLWDAETCRLKARLEDHAGTLEHLVFSPDGKTLASTCEADKTIILWDTQTGRKRDVLKGVEFPIIHLAFSADGRTLFSTPSYPSTTPHGNVLVLWDVSPEG